MGFNGFRDLGCVAAVDDVQELTVIGHSAVKVGEGPVVGGENVRHARILPLLDAARIHRLGATTARLSTRLLCWPC
jgi:hypothetical protein